MGLLVASALISIHGGHWPGLAHVLPDWLRGRLPGLIFPAEGPARRALPPRYPEGRGRAEAHGWQGRGPPVCLPPGLAGWGRVPERTALLLPHLHRTAPPRLSPRSDWPPRPTLLGAGPGAQPQTCPQVASRVKDGEHTPSRDPPSPSSSPGHSLLRVLMHRNRRLWGPFLLCQAGPKRVVGSSRLGASPHRGLSVPTAKTPPLDPGDSLAFPAYFRTKPLFPVSPDPHLLTSSPQLLRSSAPDSPSSSTPPPAALLALTAFSG